MRFASPALALARRTLLTTWLATVAVLAVACGGGGGSDDAGDDDQTVQPGDTLIVSPATATLTIANGAPVDQAYTATLHHESGVEVDVTDRVTFAIQESAIGYVSGDTLTATGAGRGTMTGTLEGIQGTAVVEVYRKDIRVEDPAPANAADLFDAATDDPARVATIVYLSDRTIVPQNLGDFDVHWTDGSGSDLFEVRMQTYYADVRVFVTGDASVGTWIAFLLAEWNVIARSELSATITVSVRGLTQADPTTASHASIQVFTSREDIEGGIYYWTAASAGGSAVGIWRHDMGAADQPSESFYTQTEAGRCVALRAVARRHQDGGHLRRRQRLEHGGRRRQPDRGDPAGDAVLELRRVHPRRQRAAGGDPGHADDAQPRRRLGDRDGPDLGLRVASRRLAAG